MNPGKLDTLLTIQQDNGTEKDSAGEHVEVWETYCTLWAEISYDSGSENGESDQLVGISILIATCRYNSGITQKMRVKNGSEYYGIEGIQPINGRQYMRLKCVKKDNDNVT